MADPKENDAIPEEPSDVVEEAEAILEDAAEASETEADAEAPEADELTRAKQEAAAWQDKYMRLHAEWDTYRRRTTEQRQVDKARAAEKIVEGLIPVVDDFERTIDYAEKNGSDNLLEGVQAVRNKFVEVLVKNGAEVIDPAGQAFDALEAQAVAMIDNPDIPDETVIDVYQKGCKLGGKVIRPAMVTVSQGGPKRETPEASEDEE